MAISDTDVLIQFILRSVNESGPGIAAAQAQLAQLEVQTRATSDALASNGAASAAMGTASGSAAVETAALGTATRLEGDEAATAAIKSNDLKVAFLGAGAASERNLAGLLALSGGASSALVVIGALAAGLEIFAVKSAVSFQSAMEMIRTQAGATQKEVDRMTQALLTMASQVGTGPEELAQALFHVESAGLRGAAALNLLRSAAELAKVGHADLTDVTNALIAVTNSHIAGIKNETDASAQLNAVIGVSNLHMQDLVSSFKSGVLPAAEAAGLHFRDLGSAIAVLSINGIPAELGMTRLRTAIGLMEAPTSKAQKALESIGISSSQLGNDMRQPNGLLVAMQDLKSHMEAAGLSAQQQSAVIYAAFGQRSASAVLTLVNNLNVLAEKYSAQEADAKKYAAEVAAEQATAAHQWDVLSAKAKVYFDIVGKDSLPAFTEALKGVNLLTEGLDAVGAKMDRSAQMAREDNKALTDFWNVVLNFAPGFDTSSASADHLTTSVDHLSVGTRTLRDALMSEKEAHGQILEAMAGHISKADQLTLSYDRLIAASKAYTASAAHEGSAGIGAATSQLQSAIAPLAPDFRAALQPLLDGFISKLATARDDYLGKVRDQDASYQQNLLSLHNAFLAKSAGLDAEHLAKLTATYDQSVQKLKSEHDRHNADLQATFLQHVHGIEAAMKTASGPGAIFGALTQKLNELADNDLKALSYAILNGSRDVGQFAAVAIRAASNKQHASDIELAASTKVALGLGDFSTVVSNVGKQLTEAGDRLSTGILKGDTPGQLARLTAAAAKLEVSHLHLASVGEDSALRIARAAGDWATVLQLLQKKLQDALSNAEGKFVSDQQSGNTGALPADRAAVDEARTKLQHLTNTVNELDGKLKTASDFSSQSAAASDRASKALGAYALALEEKKPDAQLESLRQKAQAAADEAEKYTKAQALATAELARSSHDVVVRMDAVKQSLTDTLQRAIDQGASDLRLHGAETNKDREAIARASKNLDVYNEEIAKVTPGAKQLVQTFQSVDTAAKNLASGSLDALALALLKHSHSIGLLTDRAVQAAIVQQNIDDELVKAQLKVAIAMGDFGAQLQALDKTISDLTQKAQGLVFNKQTNTPTTELTPQQIREERIAGKTNTPGPVLPTEYQTTIASLVQAEKDHLLSEQALNKVNTDVFTQTGEYAKVLGIVTNTLSTEVNNALAQATLGIGNWKGALDQAATDQEAQNQRSTAANNAWVDSEVRAALKAGDLSTAFGLLSSQITGNLSTAFNGLAGYFLTGVGDLGSLVQAWQNAKTASDQLTQANYNAFLATGQYSSALGLVSQKLSGDFSNAVDKVTLDLLNHSGDLQADTAAAQAARSSSEALTTAQWNSSYATGSATTKMQMLESSVQGVISNFNSMQSANAAVSSAQAGVTAAQAQIGLGLLQSIVTNTQDMTAVMSASAALSRSIGNEQLVAVRDQAGIITSQGALDAAMLAAKLDPTPGNLAAIAVARDQLQIQVDTARADYQAAVWLAVISKDNLTIASDKLASDRANEAAQAIVDQDKLRVAVDTEHLAVDQMKLTADTLPPLLTIASAFADVSSYQSKIDSDLQSIGNDQNQIGQDNQQLASDTSAAAMVVQQGLLQQALDSQKLAADQAASDASSQAGQLKIAQDGIQLAEDNVAYSKATAASVASIDKTTQQQLADMTVQRDSLVSAIRAMREGVYNPQVSDLERMLTGYTAEAHAAGTSGL